MSRAGDPARDGDWLDRVERDGPLYLSIARALETAMHAGELQPGDRLPPQRVVAHRVGADLTTATRAYGVARERGLVEGAVGRGTFVRARGDDDEAGTIDLSMNVPPQPVGVSLGQALRETASEVLARTDIATLMAYHPDAGSLAQKVAAAQWLTPMLGPVEPDYVQIAAGAQVALAATLAALCPPGSVVAAEPLTYPGLMAAAAPLGLRLAAVASDDEGMLPDALARTCREQGCAAVYLTPTTQNPTATTMGVARREAIADAARALGVWVIEDDPYARLLDAPLPAIAQLAPERTVHIATLSKCISPGLRIAFLVCAERAARETIGHRLRALTLMPSPMAAGIVRAWMVDGTAERLVAGVREEAVARRAIAARWLPEARGGDSSLHVWWPLRGGQSAERLRALAGEHRLSLVPAGVFEVGPAQAPGVRISLGAPSTRAVLDRALSRLASLSSAASSPALVV